MTRFLAVVLALLTLLTAGPAFADTNDGVIGTILEVEGSASVTPAGGQAVDASINMPVHLNDVVQTAAASKVFILFIDNTQLTLAENAQVRIDDYVFDPDNNQDNKAAYSSLQGAFQYVSGLIGKKDDPDVHIDTPVGSIGIRGTDFWAGTLDNQYSVAVNEGQVALKTDAGEQVVNKGEGTSVQDRHSVPAAAQAWSRDKFERIANTVKLQRQGMVWRKMRAMQGRQKYLRRRYKNYMAQQKIGQRLNKGNWKNQQQKRLQRQEERRKRQEERRARLREQRQQDNGAQ